MTFIRHTSTPTTLPFLISTTLFFSSAVQGISIQQNIAESINVPKEYIDDYENGVVNSLELSHSGAHLRGVTSDTRLRWKDYKMLVVVDIVFNWSDRRSIYKAFYTLSKELKCFKFILVNKGHRVNLRKDHLFIKKGEPGYCASSIGRSGKGRQITMIGEGCDMYGTVMHEVMHVLGFLHEHTRPDRDEYVNVRWHLIPAGDMELQYEIRPQILYTSEYDFESIMHYPISPINPYMGAQPGKVPPNTQVGQRTHLSDLDKQRLRGMYPCSNAPY